MAHQRQLIREAVKAALVGTAPTYATAAQDRVFETRMVPWNRTQLPAISVYTLNETVDPDSRLTAPRELTRNLDLAVEAVLQQLDDLDDAVDAISVQIERALHRDPTFGGKASDSLLSTTEIQLGEIGSRPVGLLRMTYSIRFFSDAPEAVDVPLDALKKVDIVTNLKGLVDEGNQAEDLKQNLDL